MAGRLFCCSYFVSMLGVEGAIPQVVMVGTRDSWRAEIHVFQQVAGVLRVARISWLGMVVGRLGREFLRKIAYAGTLGKLEVGG
ncbi:hypothetical protein T484DRAFT_1956879 [Baffinella frigidus]|nr:hypothetical protein T484DRAFT_1956879 [Cryptophyta sp. CCMP2293]